MTQPQRARGQVRIRPWAEADLDLLRRMNEPDMTEYLGGPETEEQVLARHRRYVESARTGPDQIFSVLAPGERGGVGSVGYWERPWKGETVYEIGWGVLPAYQGKGVATSAAAAVIGTARAQNRHRFVHAFPSVANRASNAICRKLGFTLVGECDFEYPPGRVMRCNDWRLDLTAPR